eukprot:scaffold1996_cov377-Prasinococcus_capsulatus_cf.AAC.7
MDAAQAATRLACNPPACPHIGPGSGTAPLHLAAVLAPERDFAFVLHAARDKDKPLDRCCHYPRVLYGAPVTHTSLRSGSQPPAAARSLGRVENGWRGGGHPKAVGTLRRSIAPACGKCLVTRTPSEDVQTGCLTARSGAGRGGKCPAHRQRG